MKNESKLQEAIETLLKDVDESMGSEIVTIKGQVHQVKALLSDAIVSLHESFYGIDDRSADQMKLFSTMMAEVVTDPDSSGSEKNIFQHIEQTAVALTELLDSLIQDSKKSLTALTNMNEMATHMRSSLSEAEKTSELLNRIHILASEENPDMDQIRDLSCNAIAMHDAMFAETKIAQGLCRLTKLVVDEVSKKDMAAVFSSKAKVEEMVEYLNQASNAISKCKTDADSVNAEMKQHMGDAIRALQFEDIVSQSLSHTDLHLDRMEGFVSRLSSGLSKLREESGLGLQAYADGIGTLREEIMSYRKGLRLEESNPVSQQSMDKGEVELF